MNEQRKLLLGSIKYFLDEFFKTTDETEADKYFDTIIKNMEYILYYMKNNNEIVVKEIAKEHLSQRPKEQVSTEEISEEDRNYYITLDDPLKTLNFEFGIDAFNYAKFLNAIKDYNCTIVRRNDTDKNYEETEKLKYKYFLVYGDLFLYTDYSNDLRYLEERFDELKKEFLPIILWDVASKKMIKKENKNA